jgi:hypothetical protein
VREERDRNRSVGSFNFMVAGVTYQGRADLIDQYLRPEQAVFLLREPTNSYDRNAVEIRTVHNVQIGYVPREYAAEMAGMLDAGFRQIAYCTKILEGKRAPIPVVQLALYRPEATVAGAVAPSEIPKRLSPGEPLPAPATERRDEANHGEDSGWKGVLRRLRHRSDGIRRNLLSLLAGAVTMRRVTDRDEGGIVD